MRETFYTWLQQRFGIDVRKYQAMQEEEVKNGKEFKWFRNNAGLGTIYKKIDSNPALFVRIVRDKKPNELSMEFKVTDKTQWNEMEQMIKEISVIVGEEICTEKDFLEMKTGRFQHGRQIYEDGNHLTGIMIDWKYVSLTF